MQKLQVKAVLFDLFDTLLLIQKGEAFYEPSLKNLYEALVKNGIKVTFEDFKFAYFEVRDELYDKSSETLEEPHFHIRVSETLKRLGYNCGASDAVVAEATEAFADKFISYVRLDEDAPNVLQKLHAKYRLGIVSNFAIPECVSTLLEKHGLETFFDTVVISGDVNKRKPSPEIFQKALRELNVKPSEAVFVGDTPAMDVKGAKALGMKTILIMRESSALDTPKGFVWQPQKDNISHEPDKTIRRLTEILDIVEDC